MFSNILPGCMRMRKLGHGQSIMFFAPPEVDCSIRHVNDKDDAEDIHVSDILVWAMTETCSEIQHRASQWLRHGVDYKARHSSWSSFLSHDIAPTELSSSWLQRESKHLEELYATARTSQPLVDEDLWKRCDSLGLRILPDNHIDDEQERETVHEIERERGVQRPPQVPAAIHHVDEDVKTFVQTGCIPEGSNVFTPVFNTLAATSAAFLGSQPWAQGVLASRDFTTTVRVGLEDNTDSYIRPVNWILSTNTLSVPVLVIISPFEVNVLLPDIRASKQVYLHVYTPRVIKMMKSCDDLRLYSVPSSLPARWRPNEILIRELNIFAGQLYFPRRRAYVKLCRFLGMYTADLEDQGAFEVQSDGFIKPKDRPEVAKYLNSFQQSPVPMLKVLFSIRRKGMGYLLTHVGRLLGARRLTNEDFEETA